jgi:hypothetical protein
VTDREAAPQQRYFLCRLIPPRTDFAVTATAEERALMREHAAYWQANMAAGKVIVFGPVADPTGDWGMGVVRSPDENGVKTMQAGDPVMRVTGFRYEILPMYTAVIRQ